MANASRERPSSFFHENGKIPGALAWGHYTSALLKLCISKEPVSLISQLIGPAHADLPAAQPMDQKLASFAASTIRSPGWLGDC